LLAGIAFGALQLRNVAKGWQEAKKPDAPAAAAELLPAPEPNPEATALLKSARERLSQWQSIQANVIQRIDVGDRRLKSTGRFVAGEFPRLRLEYEVSVGNTVGRLLEVCDGQVLHVERRIEDISGPADEKPASDKEESKDASKPFIEAMRRDVQRILRATGDAQGAAVSMHAGDLGLGGLTAMLASLDRTMVFDSIREEQHNGQNFRVIQGIWNPKSFAEIQARLGGMSQQMAMFLPERVRIYFEADSLFPVRILYLKLASNQGERRTYRPILSLEFHDVEFDAPIPADAFSYRVPAGVQQKDDTDDFIQLLKVSQGQGQAQPAPPEQPAEGLNLKRPIDSPRR
jgi:hypothetical protein